MKESEKMYTYNIQLMLTQKQLDNFKSEESQKIVMHCLRLACVGEKSNECVMMSLPILTLGDDFNKNGEITREQTTVQAKST